MAKTTNVNFKLDSSTKEKMEDACAAMGLTMSAAFTLFATKVANERRIPFEICADPFYSSSNINHLRRGVNSLNSGKGVQHELIEEKNK